MLTTAERLASRSSTLRRHRTSHVVGLNCSMYVWHTYMFIYSLCAVWGRGTPLPPCPFTSLFFPLYFSLSFIGFTYFLLLSIPSLSTGIVPLRFQAGGRRRRPNLGLVCVLLCNLCYLYFLVKMVKMVAVFCSIWFSFVCSFGVLTLLVGSFDP